MRNLCGIFIVNMNIPSPRIFLFLPSFNASLALCAFSFESCENSWGERNKSSGLERRGWKKEGEGGQDFNKNFARSSRGGDER